MLPHAVQGERRRFARLPARREVEVRFAAWPVFRVVYTMNISKGGMRVELANAVKVGDELLVKLAPPVGAPIALDAVVRNAMHTDGFKWLVGVEFTALDRTRREAIEELLATHTVGI